MLPLLPSYLSFITIALSAACFFTLYAPTLWSWIPALTSYGKSSTNMNEPLLKAIQVPKCWFRHFYILAVANVAFWIVFPFFTHTEHLRWLTPVSGNISSTTSTLLLLLMLIHVTRRLYETQYISTYSNSTMNFGHYLLGMIHYTILPVTVICEVEAYRSGRIQHLEISYSQWLGVFLFFFCNYNQHMIVRQMARVRHGKNSNHHGIFHGGWFELVSCPHFLFEIGIYLSFGVIIPNGVTFLFMLAFVVVNQTFAGILNHNWYLKTFKTYPKSRKAIFPFVL